MTKLKKLKNLSPSIFAGYRKETEGSTSMIFTASLSALLLGIAATVDVTTTLSTKSKMQSSLDAAVLAAAVHVNEDNFNEFGEAIYNVNLNETGLLDANLAFEKNYSETSPSVTVTATASGKAPLAFANLFEKDGFDVSVTSSATIDFPEATPPPVETEAPTCVMALSKTAQHAVTLNSGAKLLGEGCEMQVHSQQNRAIAANSGIEVTLDKTCVAGSGITDNSRGQVGNVELNCDVADDPYAGLFPEPTDVACDFQNGNYDRSPNNKIVMKPGVYCGYHNFNNSNIPVEFEPGLYVLKNGGWNVNGGNWSGDGVTFYFYDNTTLNFNSNVKANFTAPTTGEYANVFMTERDTNRTRYYNFNASSSFDFSGAVYLPNTRLTVNSDSKLLFRKMQLIADTIHVNGQMGFDVSGLAQTPTQGQTAEAGDSKGRPYLAR